jgi:membrane protein CcdC involved in cytochrome C biogenesis
MRKIIGILCLIVLGTGIWWSLTLPYDSVCTRETVYGITMGLMFSVMILGVVWGFENKKK